jgi:ElaB/YqjD/DUF883 family membrane-anchored ribosome-binding protein
MKTRELSGKIEDWQQKISEAARDAGEATDDYVHEHTWSSIAFAAVIGCVFGFLLGNRRE